MTVIYSGGCAVMLRVPASVVPPPGMDIAGWVEERDYHVTLQFVGKDMTSHQVCKILDSAFWLAERWRSPVITALGQLRTFRNKEASFVSLVEPTDALQDMKNSLASELALKGIRVRNDYEFTPHVTLAKHPDRKRGPDAAQGVPWRCHADELAVKYGKQRMTIMLERP